MKTCYYIIIKLNAVKFPSSDKNYGHQGSNPGGHNFVH